MTEEQAPSTPEQTAPENPAPAEAQRNCDFCGTLKLGSVGIISTRDTIICDSCIVVGISACVGSNRINAVTDYIGRAIMKSAEDVLKSFIPPQPKKPELVKDADKSE